MRIDVHTHFQSLDFIKHLQGRSTLPKTLLEGGMYAVQSAPGVRVAFYVGGKGMFSNHSSR
jgi:hypothetical protein